MFKLKNKTPKEIWDFLVKHYDVENSSQIEMLDRELRRLKFKDDDNLTLSFQKYDNIVTNLEAAGIPITKDFYVLSLSRAFSDYDQLPTLVRSVAKNREKVELMIRTEIEQRKIIKGEEEENAEILYEGKGKGRGNYDKSKCYGC